MIVAPEQEEIRSPKELQQLFVRRKLEQAQSRMTPRMPLFQCEGKLHNIPLGRPVVITPQYIYCRSHFVEFVNNHRMQFGFEPNTEVSLEQVQVLLKLVDVKELPNVWELIDMPPFLVKLCPADQS